MWRILNSMLNSSSNLMWFWMVLITWMLDAMLIAFALLLKFLWLKVVLLVFWDRWGVRILQLTCARTYIFISYYFSMYVVLICTNDTFCIYQIFKYLVTSASTTYCYGFWLCVLFFVHSSLELLPYSMFCQWHGHNVYYMCSSFCLSIQVWSCCLIINKIIGKHEGYNMKEKDVPFSHCILVYI